MTGPTPEAEEDDGLLEQLAAEFVDRHHQGETPSVDSYVQEHPHLADQIRELFPIMAQVEQLKLGPELPATKTPEPTASAQPTAQVPSQKETAQKEPLSPEPLPERSVPDSLVRLGDYRLIREIGRGGMGIVYEAFQLSLNRRVAVKVLPRSTALTPEQVRRFEREAKAAASLHHTNIVPVFDVGHQGRTWFYTMQYIPGQGLDQVIAELVRQRKTSAGRHDLAVGRKPPPPAVNIQAPEASAPQQLNPTQVASPSAVHQQLSGQPSDPSQEFRFQGDDALAASQLASVAGAQTAPPTQVGPSASQLPGQSGFPWQSSSEDARQSRSESELVLNTSDQGSLSATPQPSAAVASALAGNSIAPMPPSELPPPAEPPPGVDDPLRDERLADERLADERLADERLADERLADQHRTDDHGAEEPQADDHLLEEMMQPSGLPLNPTAPQAYFQSVGRIGQQVADALSYAHSRGVIHRDIKPSNLLLDDAGVVWITDFGLAKTDDDPLTQSGEFLGTLRYMSPERFGGQCDARGDVYALGVSLYELACLRPIFQASDSMQLIDKIRSQLPRQPRAVNPQVPRDLETIIVKAIAKDPKQRYQTAAQMGDDLQRFLHDQPILARRASLAERAVRWSRRNRALAASLVAVIMLLLALNIGGGLAALHFSTISRNQQALAAKFRQERDHAIGLKQQARSSQRQAQEAAELARQAEQAARQQRELAVTRTRLAIRQRRAAIRNSYYAQMAQVAEGATGRQEIGAHVSQLLSWRGIALPDDPRGWEWFFFQSYVHEEIAELRGHGVDVLTVDWSPNGALIASGGSDGSVRLWNALDGGQQAAIGLPGAVRAVRFHPESRRLAVLVGDLQHVTILDASNGELIKVLPTPWPPQKIAWSPDGRQLAVAHQGGIFLCTIDEKPQLSHITQDQALGGSVQRLFWHSQDQLIAVVSFRPSKKREVQFWKVSSGERVRTWKAEAGSHVAVAPNGQDILVVTPREVRLWKGDQSTLLWQAASATRKRAWSGRIRPASNFSRNGRLVAFADQKGNIRLHRVGSGRLVRIFAAHDGFAHELVFGPQGQMLASCQKGWNGLIKIWSRHRPAPVRQLESPKQPVHSLAWNPARPGMIAGGFEDGSIWLWEMISGARFGEIGGHQNPVTALAFSQDGRQLATGDQTGRVVVWDLQEQKVIRELAPLITGKISFLAWLKNDQQLLAGFAWSEHQAPHLRPSILWETDTWKAVQRPPLAAISQDGKSLLGVGRYKVMLYDTQSGELQNSWDSPQSPPHSMNPQGTLLATRIRSRELVVLSRDNRARPQRLAGNTGDVTALSFAPDSRRLASGASDGGVTLWDPTSGTAVCTLRGLTDSVTALAWSPDGLQLIAADASGQVTLWDAGLGAVRECAPEMLAAVSQLAPTMMGEPSSNALMLQARCLARFDRWDHAAQTLEKIVTTQPEDPPALYHMGWWIAKDYQPASGPNQWPGGDQLQQNPGQSLNQGLGLPTLEDFTHSAIDPDAPDLVDPQTPHWYIPVVDPNGYVPLREDLEYLLARLYASQNMEGELRVGPSQRVEQVWLNGRPLGPDNPTTEGDSSDLFGQGQPHKVQISAGWNTVAIRVKQLRDRVVFPNAGLFLRFQSPSPQAAMTTNSPPSEAAIAVDSTNGR